MLDLADHLRHVIEDIVREVPVFSHIDPNRILISSAKARTSTSDGTWAELFPMKYENGHYSFRMRRGRWVYVFKTNKLTVKRKEILYILYFYMPRFQNLSFFQKMETIFHELYHVSVECDGKLRHMHPRFLFHGPSMRQYDHMIRYWVRYYLRVISQDRHLQFLQDGFSKLREKHGSVQFEVIPQPREMMRVMASRKKR